MNILFLCRIPLLAALLPALALAEATPPPVIPARIAATATRLVATDTAPALVVAMVDDGRTAITGYGKLADGRAPDARTVFEIGSVTKTFTALLLAQQLQQGKATLDTPVADWLPGWKLPSRDGKPITLGLLAGHYSGLPVQAPDLAGSDPYADYDAKRLRAFLAGYALPRDPGAKYEYSNLGFGLLGYALSTHAGLRYGALLKRDVLQPLGMDDTAVETTPAMRARLAPGHDQAGKPQGRWHFRDAQAGCGALLSDGRDMLAYLEANMGQTRTPLAAAMKLAHSPRLDVPMGRVGLAWISTPTPDGTVVWHNGATGGYSSFVGFTADGRHGVVLLANSRAAASALTRLGMAALSAKAPLPDLYKAVQLPPAVLADYTGQYELAPGFVLTVSRDGDRLYVRATGQEPILLSASARDAFFDTTIGIHIDFQRDASGKVTALVLHQGGADHRASRLGTTVSEQGVHAVTLAPGTWRDYVGHYTLAHGAVFDIAARNGQLYAQLTGRPAFPVYASAKDRFFYTMVDATLEFQRDGDGKVVALVLHKGGQSKRAPREP
jgi:CubicO group peptidase (beta-lactamase class C family)